MGAFADLLNQYIGRGPGKISQREASRRTEGAVSQAAISLILLGGTELPEPETVTALQDALSLDSDEVDGAIAADRIAAQHKNRVRSGKVEVVIRAAKEAGLTLEEMRAAADDFARLHGSQGSPQKDHG